LNFSVDFIASQKYPLIILTGTEANDHTNYDFAAFLDQKLILYSFSRAIQKLFSNLLYENALENFENDLEPSNRLRGYKYQL
jgi:hypothetical protein